MDRIHIQLGNLPLKNSILLNHKSCVDGCVITDLKPELDLEEQTFTIGINCNTITLHGVFTPGYQLVTLTRMIVYFPRILAGHNGFLLRDDLDISRALTKVNRVMNLLLPDTHADHVIPGLVERPYANMEPYFTYTEYPHHFDDPQGAILTVSLNMRFPRSRKEVETYKALAKSRYDTTDYKGAERGTTVYNKSECIHQVKKWVLPQDQQHVTRIETKHKKSALVSDFSGGATGGYAQGLRLQTFTMDDAYNASCFFLKKVRGVFNDTRQLQALSSSASEVTKLINTSHGALTMRAALEQFFQAHPLGDDMTRIVRDQVEDYVASKSNLSFEKMFPVKRPTPFGMTPYHDTTFTKFNKVGYSPDQLTSDPRIEKLFSKLSFVNIRTQCSHPSPLKPIAPSFPVIV